MFQEIWFPTKIQAFKNNIPRYKKRRGALINEQYSFNVIVIYADKEV